MNKQDKAARMSEVEKRQSFKDIYWTRIRKWVVKQETAALCTELGRAHGENYNLRRRIEALELELGQRKRRHK